MTPSPDLLSHSIRKSSEGGGHKLFRVSLIKTLGTYMHRDAIKWHSVGEKWGNLRTVRDPQKN